ncbi:universal stress protein [Gorillibacterium massiliense]|uniref:universal stress protein n=1 Tax=Gorillibacterium massiliense TaxID=1280390 RepID=UPI0004B861E5|nr:universal stress protein [Gorillibacterium massiliense]
MQFQKILLAFDGSKASRKALERALGLVENNPGANLDVINVIMNPTLIVGDAMVTPSAESMLDFHNYSDQLMNEVKAVLAEIPNKSHFIQIEGQPAKAILDYAHNKGYDLIVIGSRGLGNIREFFLGSVSHNVVQHARIPVLVVK